MYIIYMTRDISFRVVYVEHKGAETDSSLYLLYKYNSTNTDGKGAAAGPCMWTTRERRQRARAN